MGRENPAVFDLACLSHSYGMLAVAPCCRSCRLTCLCWISAPWKWTKPTSWLLWLRRQWRSTSGSESGPHACHREAFQICCWLTLLNRSLPDCCPASATYRRQEPLQHLSGSRQDVVVPRAIPFFLHLLRSAVTSLVNFLQSNSASCLSTAITLGLSPACVAVLFSSVNTARGVANQFYESTK